jgi:hypothetical protein
MLSPNWPEISSGRVVLLTNIESLIRDSRIEVRNLFSYEIVSSLVYTLQLFTTSLPVDASHIWKNANRI